MIDANTPLVRQPRGLVKVNDSQISGWTDLNVVNNSFFAADTFRVTFAESMLPDERDAGWFSEQTDMFIEVFAGFPDDPESFSASDLTSWIYGQVDDIDYDPVSRTIEVTGRDLTRVFIDAKTTEKWPNQTSSQIAQQLAASHGLTASVTPTATLAGKYYEIDHVNMADERTEWDIISYLAQQEGYRAYVRGKVLYFEPAPDENTTPYRIVWTPPDDQGYATCNVERIRFKRALTVSRGIQVVVRSFNGKTGKAITATYPSSKAQSIKPGQSSSQPQVYRRSIHNLTQQQADQRAQQWYRELIQHEMKVNFETPADDDLTSQAVLQILGTGTKFDQRYFPESITRSMDVRGGYSSVCSAKNHSPESQATA
jgi:phage protein D